MDIINFVTEDYGKVIVGYCEDPNLTKEICKTDGFYVEHVTPTIKSKDDIHYCYRKSFTFDHGKYLRYKTKHNKPYKLSSLLLNKKETRLVSADSMLKYHKNLDMFTHVVVCDNNSFIISVNIITNTPDLGFADKKLSEFMDKYLNTYSDFDIENLHELANKMSGNKSNK